MSISTIMNYIKSINREIEQIRKKLAENHKKKSDKFKEIERIKKSITKNTSISLLKSKQGQIDRAIKVIQECEKSVSDLHKKLIVKEAELAKRQSELQKEQQNEQEKVMKMYQDNLKKQEESIKKLEVQLSEVKNSLNNEEIIQEKEYDFFISHASEDKEEIARPLFEELTKLGSKVWYDEFTMKVGDSLRRSIAKGLVNSKYGIVIFSETFFKKPWTNHELDGLVQRQMVEEKVILPIWHKVSKNQVMNYSPSLADILALNTINYTVEDIAKELFELIKE